MYEGHRKSLNKTTGGDDAMQIRFENSRSLENTESPYSEIADIFPALEKYKAEHNTANLQKLCAEVLDFCRAIYASTQNDEERRAFRRIVRKLTQI